ncbi:guanylate kinase [Theileria parva strain Muguga]|uniref:guanylate kinase n=1 Tax=Theileria parva TaxID=5875 RepID=Q4N4R4_THEPA|nr:guanylate kinase [Theileria parva strain Muguga]EAN32859.1 guanylate kinase [Theileria parva strain Muguga]|eukprot:XP_765142.1 guanylate kinase [Theileria parva strain Muguga]
MSEDLPILVIVGPSGSGKTTLNARLIEDYPQVFENSISYTSRAMRPNERDGVHYNFVSKEEFDQMYVDGEFVEFTTFVGFQYGTARSELERIQKLGKVPVLEIDIKGYKQLLDANLRLKGVFIEPPGLEILRERLIKRGCNTEESINKRVERANQELEESRDCYFDARLPNEDLDVAYKEFVNVLSQWYHIKP